MRSPGIKTREKSLLITTSGEGKGTPLQYSCLENLMDGGAWWAAVHGVAKSRTRLHFHFHFSLSCIGEGNGNPLQCSCLENPRDGGAWWAAVCGVAQSRTRPQRLSSRCSITTREKPTQHNGLAESKIGKSKLKKKNFQLHTLPAQSYFIEKSPF